MNSSGSCKLDLLKTLFVVLSLNLSFASHGQNNLKSQNSLEEFEYFLPVDSFGIERLIVGDDGNSAYSILGNTLCRYFLKKGTRMCIELKSFLEYPSFYLMWNINGPALFVVDSSYFGQSLNFRYGEIIFLDETLNETQRVHFKIRPGFKFLPNELDELRIVTTGTSQIGLSFDNGKKNLFIRDSIFIPGVAYGTLDRKALDIVTGEEFIFKSPQLHSKAFDILISDTLYFSKDILEHFDLKEIDLKAVMINGNVFLQIYPVIYIFDPDLNQLTRIPIPHTFMQNGLRVYDAYNYGFYFFNHKTNLLTIFKWL